MDGNRNMPEQNTDLSEKRVIWSNEPDLSESNLERIRKDQEDMGVDGLTDEDVMRIAYDEVDDWLSCERNNLSPVDDAFRDGSRILMFGTLGLWHGRVSGYRIIEQACMTAVFGSTCGDFVEFYCQDGELQCTDTHHDGTNLYMFRELLDPDAYVNRDLNLDPEEQDALLGQLAANAPTWSQDEIQRVLDRHTRSIYPAIAAAYGWPAPDGAETKNENKNENGKKEGELNA